MKIKNFIKEERIEILGCIIAFLLYIIYINQFFATEVLFLASFMGDIQLVGNYLDGTLSFKDLFSKFGEHGMFGYNILLLINASIFHYTAYFDVVINSVNVLLLAIIIFIAISKTTEKKDFLYYFGVFIMMFCLFNPMQGISATMETQVRLGLLSFVLSSFYIDRSLFSRIINKYFFLSCILMVITINIFGTLYNFAGYPMILLVTLFLIFKSNQKNLSARYILIIYSSLLILYFYEYGIIGAGSANKKSIIEGVLFWLDRPVEFIHGIAMYYGSAILGYATHADKVVSIATYLSIGYLVLFINIAAFILYFKSKMYNKTYLPIFLQGYTLFVIVLALIGRYGDADWDWGVNFWYHVHTKVGFVSTIWIIIYATRILKGLRIFGFIAFFIIFIFLMFGTYRDFKRAPFVKAWYENIKKYMYIDAEDMPINQDGLTPLLVNKKMTDSGLNILKSHKLSVFRKINYTNKLDKDTVLLAGNLYSDGWMSKSIKLMMNTASGKLTVQYFIPSNDFLPNGLQIKIDKQEIFLEKINKEGLYSFEIEYAPNQDVLVEMNFDKAIIPKHFGLSLDGREISAILNKLYFKREGDK